MTDDFLAVQVLARTLNCSHAVVRRYAEAKGISDLMGGVKLPGKSGLRYPIAGLPRWRDLVALHQAGAIAPHTAAAALPLIWAASAPPPPADGETIPRASATGETPADLTRIAAALERIAVAHEQIARHERIARHNMVCHHKACKKR